MTGVSITLEVRGLTTAVDMPGGAMTVVDEVSFAVRRGRTLAIVGESGCGKSMTALSVLRVLPERTAHILAGEVLLDGQDLVQLPEPEMRRVRGNDISMIFQDPLSSLNPVLTIGDQIIESILAHRDMSRRAARREAVELLQRVHMPDPESRLQEYPHRFSGGMRQRVMIAMALACRPRLLIADEPTTALDVTIQAQILELMKELQKEFETAILLITHNLGIVAEMAERVLVMYAGRVVEEAAMRDLFVAPRHPYTQGLLGATPRPSNAAADRTRLAEISGIVPPMYDLPPGCAFAPRCSRAEPRCRSARPQLESIQQQRLVACVVAQEECRA